MATVQILDAFGYKWAETGAVEALDDAQYKAGWAFIGATPPSVEQFNKVHQIADEKANYLYGQMGAIFTAGGIVPAPGTSTSLRDAIKAMGVDGALVNTRVFATPGAVVYTPTAGTRFVDIELIGGGAAGGGTPNVAGGSSIALGGGGGAGSYARGIFLTGFAGATITVGAGGVGTAASPGTAGGSSSVGALISAPGGPAGTTATVLTPGTTATFDGGTSIGSAPTGGNVVSARGAAGLYGLFLSGPNSFLSGPGGASVFGAGGVQRLGAAGTGPGNPGLSPGSGGSGALTTGASAQQAGGNGAAGLVIIREYK